MTRSMVVRLSVLAVMLALVVGLAIRFWPTSNGSVGSTADPVNQMSKDCAGGRLIKLDSDVHLGLNKLLTQAGADTTVASSDVGAILQDIDSNAIGLQFYERYTQCLKDQTLLRLQEKGVIVETQQQPPPKPVADERQIRQDDIAVIGRFMGHAQNYFSANREWQGLEPQKIMFNRDAVTVTQTMDRSGKPGEGDAGFAVWTFTASLDQLGEFAAPSSVGSEQFVLRLRCASSDCFTLAVEERATRGGPIVRSVEQATDSVDLHFGFETQQRTGQVGEGLMVQRALARLISPTHSDAKPCLAATDDPSSPQCPGYRVWQAQEMRQNGQIPY